MFKSKSRARQTSVLSRSLRYGAPVAAATALVFGFGGSAWADSEVGFVTQQTATGGCTAGLDVTSLTKSAPAYAYGTFYNFTAGYTCYAWLERSTDGGSSWYAHPLHAPAQWAELARPG
ncbi:hypothetical protein ABZ646_39320, partial [Streptomyces sp. NPDC007162]|uniref:hypothetical protein n=1 Tax=Streptomyces sp. NPDC007162 TaxID=3156917 RepID=UPI0033D1ABC1